MFKSKISWIFSGTIILCSQGIQAEELYANLVCRTSTGERTIESYNDYIVVDADDLVQGGSGFSVKGRAVKLTRELNQNPKCLSTYLTQDQRWDGEQWVSHWVENSRKWNMLSVSKKESLFLLTCGPASTLEIFDGKESFLNEIYRKPSAVMRSNITAGWLDSLECLVDRLN